MLAWNAQLEQCRFASPILISGVTMDGKVNIGVIGAGLWATHTHIPILLANPHAGNVAAIRAFGTEGMPPVDIERPRVEAVWHDGSTEIAELAPGAGENPADAATGRMEDVL
jgi:predicted dehydrogenase